MGNEGGIGSAEDERGREVGEVFSRGLVRREDGAESIKEDSWPTDQSRPAQTSARQTEETGGRKNSQQQKQNEPTEKAKGSDDDVLLLFAWCERWRGRARIRGLNSTGERVTSHVSRQRFQPGQERWGNGHDAQGKNNGKTNIANLFS
jgi:hypothetical protein